MEAVYRLEGFWIRFSMGGFAALHIAFTHPDMFTKVGGHAPALLFMDSKKK
jgi:S-formylglutathione hydrolase FrmB